jgi:hypothetical protein
MLFSLPLFTSIPLWINIRANPANFFSFMFVLNQVLSSFKEKKYLSASVTEIGNVIKILRNYVCIGW